MSLKSLNRYIITAPLFGKVTVGSDPQSERIATRLISGERVTYYLFYRYINDTAEMVG